jgi:hypothetical protein
MNELWSSSILDGTMVKVSSRSSPPGPSLLSTSVRVAGGLAFLRDLDYIYD